MCVSSVVPARVHTASTRTLNLVLLPCGRWRTWETAVTYIEGPKGGEGAMRSLIPAFTFTYIYMDGQVCAS